MLKQLFRKRHKSRHETLDNTPVSLPVRLTRPLSEYDRFRNIIRTELSQQAASQGLETFEEADDFDVQDDFDPKSPWELEFDPVTQKEMLPSELAMLNNERKKAAMDISRFKRKKKEQSQPSSKNSDNTVTQTDINDYVTETPEKNDPGSYSKRDKPAKK